MVVDYGKIIFGDVDSSDYGIYVSGEGVYNAPERAVEMINVPGRNGAVAIDQGRYENITVTYPAMVLVEDQEHYRDKLAAFRNAILSQKGYQRLEDSYHPEEYRMGLYSAGLEVTNVFTLMHGGEFDLVFNCKPQRFLKDGDDPITVVNGRSLNNYTPFDARPLLKITGYGTVAFNGYEIEVSTGETIGIISIRDPIEISSPGVTSLPYIADIIFDNREIEPGDTFYLPGDSSGWEYILFRLSFLKTGSAYTLANVSLSETGTNRSEILLDSAGTSGSSYIARIWAEISYTEDISFVYGTASTKTVSETLTFDLDGVAQNYTLKCDMIYDGDHTISYSFNVIKNSGTYSGTLTCVFDYTSYHSLMADSSIPAWGTVYVDCDIGEAYKFNSGALIDLNSKIALGSDLPVLVPGKNVFTLDNTITNLQVTPRWWII